MSSNPAVRARPTTPSLNPASTIRGKMVRTSIFSIYFLASLRFGRLSPLPVQFEQAFRRPHGDAPGCHIDRANLFGERNQHFVPLALHHQPRVATVAFHRGDLADRVAALRHDGATNQIAMKVLAVLEQ